MKKCLLTTVSMVALTSLAHAADVSTAMPAKGPTYSPVPATTWNGAYVGLQGGVVRRDTSSVETIPNVGTFQLPGNHKTGGAVGALLGYSWQYGAFVYGLEGDWNWTGTKVTDALGSSFDVNWLATIRARAGLALNSTLFYATGGVAFGHVKNSLPFAFNNNGILLSALIQDQTRAGWTVGGGVEYAFAAHWTARAEFRYVDLGNAVVNCRVIAVDPNVGDPCELGPTSEFNNRLKLGLVGLNYKF